MTDRQAERRRFQTGRYTHPAAQEGEAGRPGVNPARVWELGIRIGLYAGPSGIACPAVWLPVCLPV